MRKQLPGSLNRAGHELREEADERREPEDVPLARRLAEVPRALLEGADLVLDGGLATGTGATTVDVTEPYWRVIKEGAIAEKEIAEVLKGT